MTEYLDKTIRAWRGKWLWTQEEGKNIYCLFRKTFSVKETEGVTLHIAADTRYKLYINGALAGSGPIQSQSHCVFFDTYALSAFLRPGENTVGIVGYYSGHVPRSRGGVLCDIVRGTELLCATDGSWKAVRSGAWAQDTGYFDMNWYAPYAEFFDARLLPEGWAENGFDDSAWPCAAVLRGRATDVPPGVEPWLLIKERPIPFMELQMLPVKEFLQIEENLHLENRKRPYDLSLSLSQAGQPPEHVLVQGMDALQSGTGFALLGSKMDGKYGGVYNPAFLVDFGRVVTAYLELEVEGTAGTVLEIGFAERLVNGRFNNALEAPFATRYVLKNGRQTFRTFNWLGFRYGKLVIKQAFSSVKIHRIQAVETTYPFADRGSFTSTDGEINSVFAICKATLRLCSNEAFMDTPWREQGQWTGDTSAVTLGGVYACFGDTALAGKYFYQSAKNQHVTGTLDNITNFVALNPSSAMLDYNFWWVISLWEHYMYTGEAKWIEEYYHIVVKLLFAAFDFVDEYGLLNNIPYIWLIDWANHDRAGESAPANAIFYGALEAAAHMAAYKKDDYMVQRLSALRGLMKENFAKRFYDESKGCFADSRREDVLSAKVSESGNMLPIWFGLCDSDKGKDILRRLLVEKTIPDLVEAEPYMCLYTLKALHKLHMDPLALDIIKERWYGRMVCRGAQSTFEEWSENGSWRSGSFMPIFRSHSHAWSAGPAEYLIKHLAGLELLAPSGSKISLSPAPAAFDYDLVYPLTQGEVRIVKRGEDIQITLPPGVERV